MQQGRAQCFQAKISHGRLLFKKKLPVPPDNAMVIPLAVQYTERIWNIFFIINMIEMLIKRSLDVQYN